MNVLRLEQTGSQEGSFRLPVILSSDIIRTPFGAPFCKIEGVVVDYSTKHCILTIAIWHHLWYHGGEFQWFHRIEKTGY
jgi:hypothetical protein